MKRFQVTVTCVENGLDVAFSGCVIRHDSLHQKMIRAALLCGIMRLSVEGEVLVEQEKPLISFAGVSVKFPAGGFLQATSEAENIMGDIILTHLKKARNVVDLFSGVGTFTYVWRKRCMFMR